MQALLQPVPVHPTIQVSLLREDLLFPQLSGNKFRKLKYNLLEARRLGQDTLLTFGGAFSNHIDAVSAAGEMYGFKTIGVIRGEAASADNPTLSRAKSRGMRLEFISREAYRSKTSFHFIDSLKQCLGNFYLIPEGGTNELAVKGCSEILTPQTASFDYICCAVGTGGTLSGLAQGASENQTVIGFPALKGDFLEDEIRRLTDRSNWRIERGYEFGGYAKVDTRLIEFMNRFYRMYQIPTDPVYTGKVLYGLMDMIERGRFPDNARILVVHTGGLQGIPGMNERLQKTKLPLIEYA
jgi:1-aminocyclopropane-1-carboxylate deaminase